MKLLPFPPCRLFDRCLCLFVRREGASGVPDSGAAPVPLQGSVRQQVAVHPGAPEQGERTAISANILCIRVNCRYETSLACRRDTNRVTGSNSRTMTCLLTCSHRHVTASTLALTSTHFTGVHSHNFTHLPRSSPTHTHPSVLTPTPSFLHTHPPSHPHPPTCSHPLPHSFTLTHPVTHTHPLTHTHSLIHSHPPTHSPTPTHLLTPTPSLVHTHPHTHTDSHPLPHSFTLTHPVTHTHPLTNTHSLIPSHSPTQSPTRAHSAVPSLPGPRRRASRRASGQVSRRQPQTGDGAGVDAVRGALRLPTRTRDRPLPAKYSFWPFLCTRRCLYVQGEAWLPYLPMYKSHPSVRCTPTFALIFWCGITLK